MEGWGLEDFLQREVVGRRESSDEVILKKKTL